MEKKVLLIVNGGTPINGCPSDWEQAKEIQTELNKDNVFGDGCIEWSFDCGFKLDYDGSVITVSSRFYPPKTHYGPTWDGSVTIYFLDQELESKTFDCETLAELKEQVESFVKQFVNKLLMFFNQNTIK